MLKSAEFCPRRHGKIDIDIIVLAVALKQSFKLIPKYIVILKTTQYFPSTQKFWV